MIKLKSLLENIYKDYPLAGNIVDGREVIPTIHNQGSIEASLGNYKIFPGIRDVPMSDFHATGRHYSVQGTNRIEQLAGQIRDSNEISPLIVVIDKDGPYILEGGTRLEALYLLKAKSFPALVVADYD